jgi:hypothetical protein
LRLMVVGALVALAAVSFPSVSAATPTYQGDASAGWGYQEGDVLTANPGTWTSTTGITYSYAWFNDSNVALGTGPTYTVTGRDVGHQIYAAITATDSTAPSLTVNTPTVGPMRYRPPVNVERPTVSGALQQGSTLVATSGRWVSGGASTAPIQISYAWYRGCSTDPKPDCSNTGLVSGSSSLVLSSADVGRLISLTVTGSYPDGVGGQASSSVWLGNLGSIVAVPAASHEYRSSIDDGATLSGVLEWTVISYGARTIEFWVDTDRKLGEVTADANGMASASFDTTTVPDGTHGIAIAVNWLDGSQQSIYQVGFVTIKNAHAVVRPLIARPHITPVRPIAGKRFLVSFAVTRSDNHHPLTNGTMTCDPSVHGKVIAHTESFAGGTARLSFTIPKTVKGKLLTIKVTIRVGGQSATRIATFHIK